MSSRQASSYNAALKTTQESTIPEPDISPLYDSKSHRDGISEKNTASLRLRGGPRNTTRYIKQRRVVTALTERTVNLGYTGAALHFMHTYFILLKLPWFSGPKTTGRWHIQACLAPFFFFLRPTYGAPSVWACYVLARAWNKRLKKIPELFLITRILDTSLIPPSLSISVTHAHSPRLRSLPSASFLSLYFLFSLTPAENGHIFPSHREIWMFLIPSKLARGPNR